MTGIYETLAEGVHAVSIGGDLAILDTRADAYLCLPGAADAAVATDRGLVLKHGVVADRLRSAGLLGPSAPRLRALPALPTRTVIHERGPVRIGMRDIARAAALRRDILRARAAPGIGGFLALAAYESSADDPAAVIAAARRFWTLSPWALVEGECLVRSAMLVSWLRGLGLRADWVFGVRLWPFSAHCWVQCDEVCLNDDVERLVAYTPILVT